MAIQMSILVRNARLDAIETVVGATAKLLIYDLTAGAPANCAAAITATLLATLTLPADWMNAGSGGAKTLLGSWTGTAGADGTADFFRLMANDGTTCGMQGTVGLSGASPDLVMDNTSITTGQTITITTFTLTDANS